MCIVQALSETSASCLQFYRTFALELPRNGANAVKAETEQQTASSANGRRNMEGGRNNKFFAWDAISGRNTMMSLYEKIIKRLP